jgi:hypothetical protein
MVHSVTYWYAINNQYKLISWYSFVFELQAMTLIQHIDIFLIFNKYINNWTNWFFSSVLYTCVINIHCINLELNRLDITKRNKTMKMKEKKKRLGTRNIKGFQVKQAIDASRSKPHICIWPCTDAFHLPIFNISAWTKYKVIKWNWRN